MVEDFQCCAKVAKFRQIWSHCSYCLRNYSSKWQADTGHTVNQITPQTKMTLYVITSSTFVNLQTRQAIVGLSVTDFHQKNTVSKQYLYYRNSLVYLYAKRKA